MHGQFCERQFLCSQCQAQVGKMGSAVSELSCSVVGGRAVLQTICGESCTLTPLSQIYVLPCSFLPEIGSGRIKIRSNKTEM